MKLKSHTPGAITIDPNSPVDKLNVAELVCKFFAEHPDNPCISQLEIAENISRYYGSSNAPSQGAISKALKVVLKKEVHFGNDHFRIQKDNGEYIRIEPYSYFLHMKKMMIEEGIFSRERVYYENGIKHPHAFIFWIKNSLEKDASEDDIAEYENHVVQSFKDMLGGICMDVFIIDDLICKRVVVLLDPEVDKPDVVCNTLRHFFD